MERLRSQTGFGGQVIAASLDEGTRQLTQTFLNQIDLLVYTPACRRRLRPLLDEQTPHAELGFVISRDSLDAIRQAGIKQVFSLSNFDLPPDFFEKEILMLGSSTELQESGGHLEGEISGISAGNIPFWFRKYYRPGDEIAFTAKIVEIVASPAREYGPTGGAPSCV